jgi:hypothetical protein
LMSLMTFTDTTSLEDESTVGGATGCHLGKTSLCRVDHRVLSKRQSIYILPDATASLNLMKRR